VHAALGLPAFTLVEEDINVGLERVACCRYARDGEFIVHRNGRVEQRGSSIALLVLDTYLDG
jgi:hypothetical protein